MKGQTSPMRISFSGAVRWLVPLFVAGVLAGCSMLQNTPQLPCPRVSVLKDASLATQFRQGGGRDLTDVAYEAELEQGQLGCTYERDQSAVTVTTAVRVLAVRGPALQTNDVTLVYFVAVVDKEQNIVGRERFQAQLNFAQGQRRSGSVEEIEQVIPIRQGLRGFDYEVLVGFELQQDQLQFNRERDSGRLLR